MNRKFTVSFEFYERQPGNLGTSGCGCGPKMAAIKHNLQRDLFKPNEERLYAVVSVTKVGKKKKASFLCVAGMD